MDQNDLDKLLILSNSTEEYIQVILIKLKQNAISNGHDMSEYEKEYFAFAMACDYISHCKKCVFEIEVEYIDGKVYTDLTNTDVKCIAYNDR